MNPNQECKTKIFYFGHDAETHEIKHNQLNFTVLNTVRETVCPYVVVYNANSVYIGTKDF